MKNLYKALADFQQEVPTIKKNASGYGYKFADLEEITKVIKPLLKTHGLGYTQPLNGTSLRTILFHIESGETLESTVEVPQDVELKGQNAFQVQGSAITYLRRYSLSSLLGLVTDEDADAAGEQVKRPLVPMASPDRPPTGNQIDLITDLAKKNGYGADWIANALDKVRSSADASALIQKLKEKGN